MLVDIKFEKNQTAYYLDFFLKELNSVADYKQLITIVTCFAYDFELDPELDVETIDEIAEKTKEMEKEFFTFEISEDGIEVNI